MKNGKKNWVFCDGYLPPKGDNPNFEGHEALMVTNLTNKKATYTLKFIFEDKDPIVIDGYTLDPMRTTCIRLDKPLGKDGVLLGQEVQYTLWLKSDVKVCACFGRLDVRQTNMAYYSVESFTF